MKLVKILNASAVVLLVGIIIFPQQRVTLGIKEGIPAIPLAIPKFIIQNSSQDTVEFSSELYEVISADLKYSQVFIFLSEESYSWIPPIDPQNIVFKDWKSIEAHILLVGEITKENDSTYVFEGKLFDVLSGNIIIGKRYIGKRSLLRKMAHNFADEVMKVLGEQPIFNTKIAFTSKRDGNYELYMMDYDGHNQTRLTFSKTEDYMPAWSTDGKKIAYTSYSGDNAGLYLLDIEKSVRETISIEGTNYAPSFSPDGKNLAFCSTKDSMNSEIFVHRFSNKRVRNLTKNKAEDTAPSWSPTGRQIAFTSDRGGNPQLYVMEAEGGNVRRISTGGNYFDGASWSPDGQQIVFVARVDRIFDLYVVNLQSNEIYKLTESNAVNESPCWAPDGRHIVFSSDLSGSIQLWSIDYDGTNLKQLSFEGENKLPDWSRN